MGKIVAEKQPPTTNPQWNAVVIFCSNDPFLGMNSITDDTKDKLDGELCKANEKIDLHEFIPTSPPELPLATSSSSRVTDFENYLSINKIKNAGKLQKKLPNGRGYVFACRYEHVKITLPKIIGDDVTTTIADKNSNPPKTVGYLLEP